MGEKIMKKNLRKMKGRSAGFTLVELIVVLVILAILAAILVPALLGYIDRAREKQDLIKAKNCLNAVQAELTEAYAKRDGSENDSHTVVGGKVSDSKKNNILNRDVDLRETVFQKKVYSIIDLKDDNAKKTPYIIMFAVGSSAEDYPSNKIGDHDIPTEHDKYTVCYMIYQETEKSTPLFYFNGAWSKTNPRIDKSGNNTSEFINDYNIIQVGPLKNKRIQYYILSNQTGDAIGKIDNLWKKLKTYNK